MGVQSQRMQQQLRNSTALRSQRRAKPLRASVPTAQSTSSSVLYDVPVSNHGARVRLVCRWKGLLNDGHVTCVSPSELGGTKSEEFQALNPQGKIPLLHDKDAGLALPEADVIVQYLLHLYSDREPSLIPSDHAEYARAHLLARTHDYYISGHTQSAIYREVEKNDRAQRLQELARQLDIISDIVSKSNGPWAVGASPSFADATLLPTFTFMHYILPKYFGWKDVFAKRGRLQQLWNTWLNDNASKAVIDEVQGALEQWDNDGRFERVGIVEHVADTSYQWAY